MVCLYLSAGKDFSVFQNCQGGRCRRWTSCMLTFLFCCSFIVYLFMYTNSFNDFNIPILSTLINGDRAAFWNNTLIPSSITVEYSNKTINTQSHVQSPKNISNLQFEVTPVISSKYVTPTSNSTLPPAHQLIQQNVSFPWKQRIRELIKSQTKPLLTLFTSWSDNEDKYLVHNLTTLNWLSLRPFVMPIIFTNETALTKVCERAGWVVMPLRVTAADGIPVLKYMYVDAMRKFESNFYAFANSDILFTDTLVDTLIEILHNSPKSNTFNQDNSTSHQDNSTSHQDNSTSHQDNSTSHQDNSTSHQDNSTSHNSTQYNLTSQHHTLIVGRRTNVYNVTRGDGSSWSELTSVANKRGELFRIDAEDYFITSPMYPWNDIPEIVIGRRAYDNWLVLNARKQKHHVIDATNTILAIHQTTKDGNYEGMSKSNRDYNHNLLVSLFKSLQYGLGVTICTEYQTTINEGNILITSRNLPKYCEVQ
ncbi:hypothetical protein ACJMK2_010654 [Sinanodonta woodiana]|uniref:Nucleotide-diphospho-sugar transferase domain-containing protein n=1 Tax=Sinanodonta woodiana TaxID=1069815 RepID=A0ABD3VHL3_SINWO